MPHVLGYLRRGRQHLIGDEHCVVDIAPPDLFLKNRHQLINRQDKLTMAGRRRLATWQARFHLRFPAVVP